MSFYVCRIFLLHLLLALKAEQQEEPKSVLSDPFMDINDLNQYLNKSFNYRSSFLFRVDSLSNQFLIDEPIAMRKFMANNKYEEETTVMFYLNNFKGFLLAKKMSPLLKPSNTKLYRQVLYLGAGFLDFYDESRLKVSARKGRRLLPCDKLIENYFGINEKNFSKTVNYLNEYKGIFSVKMQMLQLSGNTIAPQVLCPLIFNRAVIQELIVQDLIDSSIRRRLIKFSNMSVDHGLYFRYYDEENVDICQLIVENVYRLTLNGDLVNQYLFRKTTVLSVSGVVLDIDLYTFTIFSPGHLFLVHLMLENMREFFHLSGNKWFNGINVGVDYEAKDLNGFSFFRTPLQIFFQDSFNEYEYGSEDFCLFKHFPFRRLTMFYAMLENRVNQTSILINSTSCTLIYLHRNRTRFPAESQFESLTFEQLNQIDCDFERMEQQCDLKSFSLNKTEHFLVENDLKLVSYSLKIYSTILLMPTMASLGFICNLLIVLTILLRRNDVESSFCDKNGTELQIVYKYIVANCVFNMVECFLAAMALINECVEFDFFFCSPLRESIGAKYFRIYVVNYGSEAMRTCSMLTMLLIAVERYADLTNRSLFKKMRFTLAMAAILTVGFVSSAPKILEFKSSFTNPNRLQFFIDNSLRNAKWFLAIFASHYILNDLVLAMLNLTFVVFILAIIRRKSNNSSNNTKNDVMSIDESIDSVAVNVMEEECGVNKAISLVFVFNFSCRLIELLFYLHLLEYEKLNYDRTVFKTFDYFYLCNQLQLCENLTQLIQTCFLLTYSLNITFYLKSLKEFRFAFAALFSRQKQKHKQQQFDETSNDDTNSNIKI